LWVLFQNVVDEIRTNETTTSRDEDSH